MLNLLLPAVLSKEAPGADIGGQGAPLKGIAEGGWAGRIHAC